MAGILTAFGFPSKKASAKTTAPTPPLSAESGKDNGAVAEHSTLTGHATQGSFQPPPDDRTSTMRLSKNTPLKTTETEFEIPSDPVVPNYNSGGLSPKPMSVQRASPNAVIGAKITFKGELSGEEDLLIQGTVEGTVDLKGHQLTVGEQGTVRANLTAKVIIIEGTVEGDLIAQERIEIKASSKVKGSLIADRVILEDGAQFRGSIDMSDKSGMSNKIAAALPNNTNLSKGEKLEKQEKA